MIRPRTAWLLLAAVWLTFFSWYTSFEGPLTEEEVAFVLDSLQARSAAPEDVARLRRFLESDTGDDFVMVNLIEMNDPPPKMEGVPEDATAQDLMDRYMEHMYPELFARASHPVLMGQATAPALDIWGIEGADEWTTAGLMRYRSRRDMLEIAGNPDFQGPHGFKIAAMNKTIAFPADPWLQLGDPRLVLALLLMIVGLANSLRWVKRQGRSAAGA
jgi:hypothetical protein